MPNLDDSPKRPLRRALHRGWRRRCPKCGAGDMMDGFLKVRHTCFVCGEELHHHRADDGPPYLTILIVAHIIGPVMLSVYTAWQPEPLLMASLFSVGAIALSLYLLPRLKGLIVGLQWAHRLHGFGRSDA